MIPGLDIVDSTFLGNMYVLNENMERQHGFYFALNQLHHRTIEQLFFRLITFYRLNTWRMPKALTLEIMLSSNPEDKKEFTFHVDVNPNGTIKLIGWDDTLDLEPINSKLFDAFLYEQGLLGKIELALERHDESAFLESTTLLKQNKHPGNAKH